MKNIGRKISIFSQIFKILDHKSQKIFFLGGVFSALSFTKIVPIIIGITKAVIGQSAYLLRPFRRQNNSWFYHNSQISRNMVIGFVPIFEEKSVPKCIVTDRIFHVSLVGTMDRCKPAEAIVDTEI